MTTLHQPLGGAPEPGGSIPPPLAMSGAAPTSYPRIPIYPRFLFVAHPERVTVLHGRVVYELVKLAMQPGVNRVDSRGYVGDALAERVRRGWMPVAEDIDGPGTSYVRRHQVGVSELHGVHSPVYSHLDRWEKVYPGSAEITEGGEPYAIWCRSLIDRGVLPRPRIYVIERLIDARRSARSAALDKLHAFPSRRVEIEVYDRQIDALERELETLRALEAAAEGEALEPVDITPPQAEPKKGGARG
jgi:hypothetical protein